MQRIPDNSSIFTAEAKAVHLTLDFIRTYDTNNTYITFREPNMTDYLLGQNSVHFKCLPGPLLFNFVIF